MFQLRRHLRLVAALSVFIPAVSPYVCAVLNCCSVRSLMTAAVVPTTHDHSSHCGSMNHDDGSCGLAVFSGVDDCCPASDTEAVKTLDADYVLPSATQIAAASPNAAVHAADESGNILHCPPELRPPRA
jgi:hypothetical protein